MVLDVSCFGFLRLEIRRTCRNEFWHVSPLKYDSRTMISNSSSPRSSLHGNTGVINYVNISTLISVLVGNQPNRVFIIHEQILKGPRAPERTSEAPQAPPPTNPPTRTTASETPGENDAHRPHLHRSNRAMPQTDVLFSVHNKTIYRRRIKLMSHYRTRKILVPPPQMYYCKMDIATPSSSLYTPTI